MCTARPPFRAETTFGVLRRIRETPPRSIREINADIPIWLERLVMKLLEKDAAERIDTAEAVATLLESCLAHVQQPTTVPLPAGSADWSLNPVEPPPPPTPVPRLRVRSALLAATALLFAALIVTWLSLGPRNGKHVFDDSATITDAAPPTAPLSSSDVSLDWAAAQTEPDAATEEIEHLEATMNDDPKPGLSSGQPGFPPDDSATPTPNTSQPTDPLVEDDQ